MPERRFDWHEHLREVWGEGVSARGAVDHLAAALAATPDLLDRDSPVRTYLRAARDHVAGTYIIRLFAAFEAALRSFDQAQHHDPDRVTDAGTMIDQIGGRRGRGISASLREGAHDVRRVRNFWAHESDTDPGPMTIDDARSRLQRCLSELPEEW